MDNNTIDQERMKLSKRNLHNISESDIIELSKSLYSFSKIFKKEANILLNLTESVSESIGHINYVRNQELIKNCYAHCLDINK